MVELVDTQDLKFCPSGCGFESHWMYKTNGSVVELEIHGSLRNCFLKWIRGSSPLRATKNKFAYVKLISYVCKNKIMFEIGEEIYFKIGSEGMVSAGEVYNTSKAIIVDKIESVKYKFIYKIQAIDIKGKEEGYRGIAFWYPEWLIE